MVEGFPSLMIGIDTVTRSENKRIWMINYYHLVKHAKVEEFSPICSTESVGFLHLNIRCIVPEMACKTSKAKGPLENWPQIATDL